MLAVQTGAATVDITPPVGLAMGGYGARQGVAAGIHDPLLVRTLVFADGHTQIVWAVCDLVAAWPDIVDAARRHIERDFGIPPAHVLVAATHTHSGPAGLSDRVDAAYVDVTARKIAGSVAVARDRLRPVSLKIGSADVPTIGQNRRHPDGPTDPEAMVLLAAPPGGGVVATLVNHATHATVLESDNLLYSADFPGAAARAVERAVGGTAVYLQGACGDVNPVWMRHDFEEVQRVGGILGAAAVRTVHELRPVGEGQWAVNLSWTEEISEEPVPGTMLTDVRLAAVSAGVDLPRRVVDAPEDIEREIVELEAELGRAGDDIGRRRALRPRLNQLRMELFPHAGRGRGLPGGRTERAEVQAFRLGAECVLVSLPGEFFAGTGLRIRRELARDGVAHVLIAGYANQYLGYVPPAVEFPAAGYEVGCARFEPDAARMVEDAAIAAARQALARVL